MTTAWMTENFARAKRLPSLRMLTRRFEEPGAPEGRTLAEKADAAREWFRRQAERKKREAERG